MTPRPPAFETVEARGAVDVCAIPASRIGCLIPRRLVRGVLMVGLGMNGEAIVDDYPICEKLYVKVHGHQAQMGVDANSPL